MYPFCLPAEIGQLVRIALKYIRNHPEKAQEKSVFLAVDSLHEALPCKE
jgi:hypothetical protein